VRFEFIGGALCLDFANTIHDLHAADNEDELREPSDLLQWAKEAGILSLAEHDRLSAHYTRSARAASAALGAGIATRDLMLAIFGDVAGDRRLSPERLAELNAALARIPALLSVETRVGRLEMQWQSAADGLDRALFSILTDAARLLGSRRVGRIRRCASEHCTWLFVDGSRNRSRRWCDMSTCGNRMKARRHYRRSRANGPRGE